MNTMKYVPGTDPNNKYLIIAESGRCVLGIKPEFIYSPLDVGAAGKCALVVRLRLVGNPDLASEFEGQPLTQAELAAVAPHIKWPMRNAIRFSTALGTEVPKELGFTFFERALRKCQEKVFCVNTSRTLVGLLPSKSVHTAAVVADYLQQGWEEQVLAAKVKMQGPPPPLVALFKAAELEMGDDKFKKFMSEVFVQKKQDGENPD